MKKVVLSTVGLMLSMSAMAQSIYKVDLSPFPAPEAGMKQVVIEVPHSENDQNKKLEIFVGKEVETDTCNRHSLTGTFKSSDLSGWGYSYLTFESKGDVIGTRMACPDNEKKVQFVTSQGYLTNYNGRMPVVLYIPQDMQAKFKIYTAEPDLYSAAEIMKK